MLSEKNIREFNKMIEDELRAARFGIRSERDNHLRRAAEIKAILEPTQPSREDLLAELAAALLEQSRKLQAPSTTFGDALIALLNR